MKLKILLIKAVSLFLKFKSNYSVSQSIEEPPTSAPRAAPLAAPKIFLFFANLSPIAPPSTDPINLELAFWDLHSFFVIEPMPFRLNSFNPGAEPMAPLAETEDQIGGESLLKTG